ncbi:AAA family ATPase [Amycolatopsis sp. NPDC005232]|uniref:helix-turn-helix transcriptional regulator n=1 Tax=Amycolatopsis sp. NPDC005232 TaxID=3157027 RepID=UPI0033AC26D6
MNTAPAVCEPGIAPRSFDDAVSVIKPPRVIGRRPERARLQALMTAAAAGSGSALVIRGLAGFEKSTLLGYAADLASGWRVVRLRGVIEEASLPYSALHLLCSALGREMARLAPHQREALEIAVGLRAGAAPDRLVVCVATGRLLALAAEARPLVCLVDDVHWLDTASADVFAFVARRAAPTAMALLFADRDEAFADLPGLPLGELDYADSRELIETALPSPLDHAVVARMVAEAHGNPRALLERAAEASPGNLGGYGVATSAESSATSLAGLAPDSSLLLLLAAAEPLGDPVRLWRAADRLRITPEAAEQLESEGLVSFGTWVTLRDSRLRGIVYRQAVAATRQRVHSALAAATDPLTEPDRHAWHLAHAFADLDDDVTTQLLNVTEQAAGRGGAPAEAAFLARAAVRSADPVGRARLAIAAAESFHAAGASQAAARSLAIAVRESADAHSQARLARLHARMTFYVSRNRAAVAELVRAAEKLATAAPFLAEAARLEAIGAGLFTGHLDALRPMLAPLTDCAPGSIGPLLAGLTRLLTTGYETAAEPLKLAIRTPGAKREAGPRSRLLACLVAADLWDAEPWDKLTSTELTRARKAGARATLPYLLTHRALVEIHLGSFGSAQALVDEAGAVTRSAGTSSFPHAATLLAAWRGLDHPEMAVSGNVRSGDETQSATMALHATAVLRNGLEDHAEAAAAIRDQLDSGGTALVGWALAELVEGAARSGDRDAATAALAQLSERAGHSRTDWALGVAARSKALLESGAEAEALYREAIERLARTRIKTHLARAHLVYGEWLTARGRRADARATLRTAHEAFTRMGAMAFADRASRKLSTAGERVQPRTNGAGSPLTTQESRIAALAHEGRTNREIAVALMISARTVEYHLHKVFTKLSIASRAELHRALSEGRSK